MARWLTSAEALLLHHFLCDIIEAQIADPHGSGSSSAFMSDSVCVIYGEGKETKSKIDIFSLLEKDMEDGILPTCTMTSTAVLVSR